MRIHLASLDGDGARSPLVPDYSDFPDINYCPHCYQSRGPMAVRARGEANTPADVLEKYGGGNWPLRAAYDLGELASNGNYLEPQEISVRHGICGDPEQVCVG